MSRSGIGLFVLACVLSACARTEFAQTGRLPEADSRRIPADVDVYHSRPSRPYREAGIIVSRGGTAQSVVDALRAEGAARGCDGVVITESADEVTTTPAVANSPPLLNPTAVVTTPLGTRLSGPVPTVATGSTFPSTIGGGTQTTEVMRGTCIVYSRRRQRTEAERRVLADRARVSQSWSGGQQVFHAQFGNDEIGVEVTGVPRKDPKRVAVEVRVRRHVDPASERLGDPAHEHCTLKLEMDERGTAEAEPEDFTLDALYEHWKSSVPIEAVARMALAKRVHGGLCETAFSVGSESRDKLGSFVRLFLAQVRETGTAATPPEL